MIKAALNPDEGDSQRWKQASREWTLRFLRTPSEILISPDGRTVTGVKFVVNSLQVSSVFVILNFVFTYDEIFV
jgi:hypothetical protein